MKTVITTTERKERRENPVRQSAWQRIILLIVLAYEGLGGVAGGGLLIAAPDGRLMDMPVDILHGFFPDFLVPGIFLLWVIVLAVILLRRELPRAVAGEGIGKELPMEKRKERLVDV